MNNILKINQMVCRNIISKINSGWNKNLLWEKEKANIIFIQILGDLMDN